MLSGHGAEIDCIRVFSIHALSIALVVSKAVFDADDDPGLGVNRCLDGGREMDAYHKFVKTTPKPRATKKSKGELGPLPLLDALVADGVADAEEAEAIAVDADMLTDGRGGGWEGCLVQGNGGADQGRQMALIEVVGEGGGGPKQ